MLNILIPFLAPCVHLYLTVWAWWEEVEWRMCNWFILLKGAWQRNALFFRCLFMWNFLFRYTTLLWCKFIISHSFYMKTDQWKAKIQSKKWKEKYYFTYKCKGGTVIWTVSVAYLFSLLIYYLPFPHLCITLLTFQMLFLTIGKLQSWVSTDIEVMLLIELHECHLHNKLWTELSTDFGCSLFNLIYFYQKLQVHTACFPFDVTALNTDSKMKKKKYVRPGERRGHSSGWRLGGLCWELQGSGHFEWPLLYQYHHGNVSLPWRPLQLDSVSNLPEWKSKRNHSTLNFFVSLF